jgi:2-deoxy-D-gluconate 3-dehydrogenase
MLPFQGGIRVPSYTASKSGVNGAPGYMETDNTATLRADAKRNSEILSPIPAGRWGAPRDIACAVVFIASSASAYLTGHTLAVDGGWLAR